MLIPRKLLSRILDHFDGDMVRAKLWFDIPNPVLNGLAPKNYHQGGSWKRLEKMIDDALEEYNEQRTKSTSTATA